MVSASSTLAGHGEIAYGNAIGSIICNAAFICALTLAIKPQKINKEYLKKPLVFFYVAAILYSIVAYFFSFTVVVGIVLLSIYVIYNLMTIKKLEENKDKEEVDTLKAILNLIIGLIGVVIGADLLVNNGIEIANMLNVPESAIGLTIVAFGTSLPEFTTAIISLKKGHSELSIGNIIGANLYNLIFVSGVSITLNPFDVPSSKMLLGINSSLLVDLPLMFIIMILLTTPVLIKGRTYRWQGILLIVIYIIYTAYQFII